ERQGVGTGPVHEDVLLCTLRRGGSLQPTILTPRATRTMVGSPIRGILSIVRYRGDRPALGWRGWLGPGLPALTSPTTGPETTRPDLRWHRLRARLLVRT